MIMEYKLLQAVKWWYNKYPLYDDVTTIQLCFRISTHRTYLDYFVKSLHQFEYKHKVCIELVLSFIQQLSFRRRQSLLTPNQQFHYNQAKNNVKLSFIFALMLTGQLQY